MKYAFLATILSLSFVTSSMADSIKFYIPNKAGGGGFMISDLLAKGLQERGWTVDFKALGNCAVVKEQLNSEKTPYLTVWENIYMLNETDKCYFSLPDKNEIMGVHAASPYTLCVAKDSPITPEDILQGKNQLTLVNPNGLFGPIVEELKNKVNSNFKIVAHDRAKDALISGEIQVYFGTQGIAMQKNNQAKCYFNTGKNAVHNTVPLNSVISNLNMNKQTVYFSIAKNLTDVQKEKMRNDLQSIMTTEEWKKLTSRWDTPEFKNFEEAYNFLKTVFK